MKRFLLNFFTLLLALVSVTAHADFCALQSPDIQNYIDFLVTKHDFDRQKMENLFCTVTMSEEVYTKTLTPLEAKPWYIYKEKFLTADRIQKGVAYWNKHEALLAETEKKYNVPASVIVAIIGVETKYGENKGTYPVFNTLVSLSFNHGRREAFFRSELTEYLLLTRENNLMPLQLKGSYAGAVGLPQFMPSSYRHYAVDFHNKGFSDLFENDGDAIASVGNYLHKMGWQYGTPVAIAASVQGNCEPLIAHKKYKPTLSESDLATYGISPMENLQSNKACLIRLEVENGNEYWLGLQNFYAISRYNNSELYVMAVNLLAQKLREEKLGNKAKPIQIKEEKEPALEKPVIFSNDHER